MIELLLFVITALCVLQQSARTQYAVLVFVVSALVHDAITKNANGALYYILASLCDFIALFLITRLHKAGFVVRLLACSCIISAVFNFVGWVIWVNYYPPIFYNTLFIIMYSLIAVSMWSGASGGVRTRDDSYLFFSAHSSECARARLLVDPGKIR